MNIPVNNSEMKSKGLIKKEKHAFKHQQFGHSKDMVEGQQNCCQAWRCLNSLHIYTFPSKAPCDLEDLLPGR